MIFYKAQATGNDFIVFDFSAKEDYDIPKEKIKFLCDRHFGIGADGILLILKHKKYDFRMKFYNPDGSQARFCGNGGRCIALIANYLNIAPEKGIYIADDTFHFYEILNKNFIKISMTDIKKFYQTESFFYVNSGTHHTVFFQKNLKNKNIIPEAKKIRYSDKFQPEGTNVNFVEIINEKNLFVRTYEKGVENETLSCGTGVVASAIAFALKQNLNKIDINILTKGGNLNVKAEYLKKENKFVNVCLSGECKLIFKGTLTDFKI